MTIVALKSSAPVNKPAMVARDGNRKTLAPIQNAVSSINASMAALSTEDGLLHARAIAATNSNAKEEVRKANAWRNIDLRQKANS